MPPLQPLQPPPSAGAGVTDLPGAAGVIFDFAVRSLFCSRTHAAFIAVFSRMLTGSKIDVHVIQQPTQAAAKNGFKSLRERIAAAEAVWRKSGEWEIRRPPMHCVN